MTTDPDARLAALVADAVSSVEPREALDELRARTAAPSRPGRRSWLYAGGGAVLATAAVITTIAVLAGGTRPDAAPDPGPGPATQPTTAQESTDPTSQPSAGPTVTVAAYYLGDTPRGPRLFREFDRLPGTDPLDAALTALALAPADPDYRTAWTPESFAGASFDGVGSDGVIQVSLADASLHDRPSGMSAAEAGAAIQQVVYTLQGAVQARAGVQFLLGGNPIDTVLGVPTSEPLTNAAPLEILNHVSITSPAEGATVSGAFDVTGVASSFEATVHWQLLAGGPAAEGSFTAEGYQEPKLFPFSGTVDLSGVQPGRYTLVLQTDDPSGGAEGHGPDTDTRTVVVR